MTLGDRIVVMNKGIIQQVDTPQNLYDYPVNRFVAGFIGSPAMNFFKGIVMARGGFVSLCTKEHVIRLPEFMCKIFEKKGYYGREVELGIRPELFSETEFPEDVNKEWSIRVLITAKELLGSENILHFQVENKDCCARVSGESSINKGDLVTLWMNLEHACIFDAETQENIMSGEGRQL